MFYRSHVPSTLGASNKENAHDWRNAGGAVAHASFCLHAETRKRSSLLRTGSALVRSIATLDV